MPGWTVLDEGEAEATHLLEDVDGKPAVIVTRHLLRVRAPLFLLTPD